MNTLKWIILFGCLSVFNQPILSQVDEVQAFLDSSQVARRVKSKADSFARLAYQKSIEIRDIDSQLEVLIHMAKQADYHYMSDSAYVIYNKALELAKKENKQAKASLLYLEMGWIQHNLGKQDEAISLLSKSLESSEIAKDTSAISEAYDYLGIVYNNLGNHDKAIENYLISLELAEQINDRKRIFSSSQGIGIIYNKQEDYQKAELYFEKAMKEASALNDTAKILGVINDFGILNKNKGNYPDSENWYLKMLEISEKDKYAWAKPFAFNNLATLYFKMEKYTKGEEYGGKGVSYWKADGNKRNESDALNSLAKNQLALNKIQTAIQSLERSLLLSRETKSLEKERDALLILSEAYDKNNQAQLALNYFKEHKTLYDKIYDSKKSEQIHNLEQKYQSEKKDKEINILANNAVLDKVKRTRLWISLGLSFFFSTLLFWFQIQKRRKEKLVEQEKQKVIQLENLRLSQELDFKKQELASKVLQLCRKNEFLQSLDKRVKELKLQLTGEEKNEVEKLSRQINRDMEIDADWEQFLKSFETVHPDFNATVTKKHPEFSKGEFRMACLLKMNLTTKDIANLLNITISGVKKTRNRMRKKMAIDSSMDLSYYFMSLNM